MHLHPPSPLQFHDHFELLKPPTRKTKKLQRHILAESSNFSIYTASFWASRVDQISFRSQVILDNLFGPGIGIGDIV